MDLDWLREAYRRTRKDGAKGVDGQSGEDFGRDLEGNLQDLLNRAKSGTYRAPPVRRVDIPKGDGRTRPLGIPTFEDKVLQRAVVMLLEPIYEEDFYDFSYGFRPHRSPHDALRALDQGLAMVGGGWVLDVDLSNFFDTISHEKLRQVVSQRVVDGVVKRLIGKWLKAGVLDEGVVKRSAYGTPQGGVVSPLLANIYLHEALDRWWVEMVLPALQGPASMVRFADDFVMVFESQWDAERALKSLKRRMAKYELVVHPEKTRLVRFGRPKAGKAVEEERKPRSFDFLGFTHFWCLSRKGRWRMRRKTSKKRFSRGLTTLNDWLRRFRHLPVREQSRQLGLKLRGHFAYYGVSGNSDSIKRFRHEVLRLWRKWLSRRSQKAWLTWEKFHRLVTRNPLPAAKLRRGELQLRLANL
jgi:group II intron reverse transcriptase/maturase